MVRKLSSRTLSLILALTMIIMLLCPVVMAKENQEVLETAAAEKHAYTVLGDSVASGFSLRFDTQWNEEVVYDTVRNAFVYWRRPMGMHQTVPTSYPTIVAETLGIKSANQVNTYYNNLARCGVRTHEIRRFLDAEYNAKMAADPDEEGNRKILNDGGYAGVTARELRDLINLTPEYVAQSKLITLQVGSNDITHAVTDIAPFKLQKLLDQEEKGISVYGLIKRLEKVVNNGGNAATALVTVIGWAEQMSVLPETLAVYLPCLIQGVTDMMDNYKAIVKRIYELNPDCTLVAVGLYNPFKDLKLTDLGLVKVGEIVSIATEFGNSSLKTMSPSRDFDYRFCDISDVKLNGFTKSALSFLMDGDLSGFNFELTEMIHPGTEGHQYIADQILKVLGSDYSLNLPEEEPEEPVEEGAYRITSTASEGGTISVSANSAKPGETVTVQVMPNAGYHLKEVSYYGDTQARTSLAPDANGTASFQMPAEKITVVATFVSDNATDPMSVFIDVNAGDWYEGPVKYAVQKGFMAGTSSNTFSPNDPLTRAMVVQILYAIKSKPPVDRNGQFSDVQFGDWYNNAVSWAAEKGIVAGFEDGTFRPNQNVTREELATMLRAFTAFSNADSNANGTIDGFADASSVSTWAVDHIKWAVGHGIMAGKPGNLIDPKGTATRAEMATMIYQLMTQVIGDRY